MTHRISANFIRTMTQLVFRRERVGDSGDPHGEWGDDMCYECGRKRGEYHEPGCDFEACGICGGQRIACGCNTYHVTDNFDKN